MLDKYFFTNVNAELLFAPFPRYEYWFKLTDEEIEEMKYFWFSPKLDGTNIGITITGDKIRLMTRKKAVASLDFYNLFIEALEYVCENEGLDAEEWIKQFLKYAEQDWVYYGELYGRKNSPAGVHANSIILLNYSIFNIREKPKPSKEVLRWINPQYVFDEVIDLFEPFYQIILRTEILKQVKNRAELFGLCSKIFNAWSESFDLEGIVIKYYNEEKGSCVCFKWKPAKIEKVWMFEVKEVLGKNKELVQQALNGKKRAVSELKKIIREELKKHGFEDVEVNFHTIQYLYNLSFDELMEIAKYVP